jgi:16S rRNA (adenine1518-N6/adenine1519-N6)-dimethyltransferase
MNRLPLPQADKSLGQHFLKDKNVIEKICFDFLDKASAILEIGPGPGILTETLATHKIPFSVIEKDVRFKIYLEQFLSSKQIHLTDALNVDLEKFIHDEFPQKKVWLVSNLPYNVASPLLVNFLQTPSIEYMTLMFQKEVADKVFAFSTTKNVMNSLMVISQTYFECELLLKVPPGAFTPPPRVDSAVLSMKRRSEPFIPFDEFKTLEKFSRLVFSQKRKQLGGILKSRYDQIKIKENFLALNLDTTVRAEALTLQNILDLYRIFK